MSKPWTPPKHTAKLKPSRIRREPVQLVPDVPAAAARKPVRLSDREQMWFGVTGVLLFAAALTALIVGIAIATLTHDDPDAAARARRFAQCYEGGQNCVVDGNTIFVRGQRVEIAGVTAPEIRGAQCDAERDRGIDTAVKLAAFLNSGSVAVGQPFREYGREVRKVEVKGRDVGDWMIAASLAREDRGGKQSWC
jgi:endonuclease YncB( thermonuclease family)